MLFERLRGAGKLGQVALVAVMRKLIYWMFGVEYHSTVFIKNHRLLSVKKETPAGRHHQSRQQWIQIVVRPP